MWPWRPARRPGARYIEPPHLLARGQNLAVRLPWSEVRRDDGVVIIDGGVGYDPADPAVPLLGPRGAAEGEQELRAALIYRARVGSAP